HLRAVLHASTLIFFLSASGAHPYPPSFPTRRSSDLLVQQGERLGDARRPRVSEARCFHRSSSVSIMKHRKGGRHGIQGDPPFRRSEEHTSELQSLTNLVCRLLLEKKNTSA